MSPEKRQNQASGIATRAADHVAYLRRTSRSGLILSAVAGASTMIRGEFIIKGNGAGFTELRRSPGESIQAFTERAQGTLETEFQNKLECVQNEDSDQEFLANFVATHNRDLQPEE